ncbi:MAG: pilus assembly protein PilM [Syntrophobacterales bacterium]|jgi:type IV pilus assembly protein PilM
MVFKDHMLKFGSKYPIGIDIGNRNIYAAQLKENRQGLVIRAFLHREFDEVGEGIFDAGDAIVPLLRDIVKHGGFRGKRVVVDFPSQYLLNFPVMLQVGKEETLEEAILRQSREYINFPIEEAIIDYPSLEQLPPGDGGKYRVNVIAVRREHMNQYLQMLERAGLSVEAVDFGMSSLIRLHSYPQKSIENPTILCNIGYSQSLLSVVTRDSIIVQRHVPWGLHILVRNLQTNLELSDDRNKAKLLLKKYGLYYEDCLECTADGMASTAKSEDEGARTMYRAIYQIINPRIEELVHEFHKIIGYARSEQQNAAFEGIYIYGQGTLIHHLDSYLEKRLNSPTRLVNPLSKIALTDGAILPDLSEGGPYALALGLAMRKVSWL